MEDDEARGPIWPSEMKEAMAPTVEAGDLAHLANVSTDLLHVILRCMAEAGKATKVMAAVCPVSKAVIARYEKVEDIPEEIDCPVCGSHQTPEINFETHYRVSPEAFRPGK